MTTDELKDYYKKLLIIQYAAKTKALATVDALVKEVIADQVYAGVRDAFDLDTAQGEQLDILGKYRGLQRIVYGINITKDFFSMPPYAAASPGTYNGFASYGAGDGDIDWFFIRYKDIVSVGYRMTDAEFRTAIEFAASVHSSELSLGEIDLILEEFFGNYATVTDNGDMTLTYNDQPADPNANIFNLIAQMDGLPKPAGVSISVTHV